MNNTKKRETYCRLCADSKPHSRLTNLQTDVEKRQDIVNKLTRFNLKVDFSEETLSSTVCYKCTNKLNRAYEFVTTVEHAQTALTDFILEQQIKDESGNENPVSEDLDVSEEVLVEEKLEIKDDSELLDYAENSQVSNVSYKLTWDEYNWSCIYCGRQFGHIDELKIHLMQYHKTCNTYQCIDCATSKLCLNEFLVHAREHRKYLKYSCYKCSKKFSTIPETKSHEAKYITSTYICFGCNTNFSTSNKLNVHINTFCIDEGKTRMPVPINNISLTCIVCTKTLKSQLSLDRHLLSHVTRKIKYICDTCGKGFVSKNGLSQHVLVHSDARPFPCKVCKFSFKTRHELRFHVTVHYGVKPFTCDVCGKSFRLRKELIRHNIIHTDTVPHICAYCSKGFRFRHLLIQHIRLHTGEKPYSCEICHKKFTNWANYNKHMVGQHGIEKSKRKRTSDGPCAVDPATGKVIQPEMGKLLGWKSEIMKKKKPGRQKKIK